MRKNYITNPYLEGLPGRWYKVKVELTGPDTLPVITGDIPVEIGVISDTPILIFPEGFSIIDRVLFFNPLEFSENASVTIDPNIREHMTTIYPGRVCFNFSEFFESEGVGETLRGSLIFFIFGCYNN